MSVVLTVEQRRIIDHDAGPLRIAAGAGTGKTGTLQGAIVERIEAGVSPGEILCLTFTVEATKEMRRRVLAALSDREGIDPDELTVQTYHAFAASIVREHAPLIGLDVDAALLDRARQWQLTLESLDRCTFSELEIGWLPSFVGRVLALHEEMLRHVVTPDQVRAWCSAQPAQDPVPCHRAEAVQAVEHYRALKLERGALDFGDQIALAVDVLRTRPDVLTRLRSRFRFVYLDEYQDTDVAQRELVKLVAADAKVVCAVGDVDQGIFGWRGASIHNMFAFGDDFPGARFETLSTNFRSGKRILDLANALIDVWDRPRDEERKPLVPADNAPKAVIEAFESPHQIEEAEEIASRIAAGGAPWSQYAVLTRTRGDFDSIYRALASKDVPVEVDTLGGFWTRPEILDVVSWLRVLDDPGDNLALGRLLIGPAYRLGRRDLFFLADHAKDENYRRRRGDLDLLPYKLADSIVAQQEIPELSDDARERIGRFVDTWLELARIATRVSLADLVGEIARVSGLAAELAASPNPEAELALRHVAKLRDIAQGYQPVAGSLDLGGFVDYLDSMDEAEQDEDELRATEENAVRLLTLHRAKGLEWDVVFLPCLVKGHMPHPGRGGNNPEERWERLPFELRGDREFLPPPPTTKAQLDELRDQEERRLMYVGVTRARRRLVLSRAWYYRDNVGAKQPSPFWDEALATGLVAAKTVACPPENPYSLGVEQQYHGAAPFEPPPPEPAAVERLEADVKRLRELEAKRAPASEWQMPSTLSVTAFLTFVRDPDEFFRRYIRRVPSPPSPAAKLGTELHRKIELHARGVTAAGGLPQDAEEPYDLDLAERSGAAGSVSVEQMWGNFQRSRFAGMEPLMTEQPFTLYLGHDVSVAGRIDAIYEGEHGEWEIVDFKTGKSDPDPMQLALYARAVNEIWRKEATCKWFLLRDGREVEAPAIAEIDKSLEAAARRIHEITL